MRKGTKIGLAISLACAVAGAACVLTGLALGAGWRDVKSSLRSSLDVRHTPVGERLSLGVKELLGGHNYEVSELQGEIFHYSGIRRVEVEAGMCSVSIYGGTIESRDTVGVERMDGGLRVEKNGDTLEIKSRGWAGESGSIGLYLPEKELEELSVEAGAGTVYIDGLNVEQLDMEVSAGQIDAGGLLRAREAQLEVGLGSMRIDWLEAERVSVDCGMGSFTAGLTGKEEDYYFTGDCGLGSLDFGNKEYSGIADAEEGNPGAGKSVDVDCGLGSVEIFFEE